jgi:hypothetical protein
MDRRRELLEALGMKFVRSYEIPESRSKYVPHQGSKELARRVKQMLRNAAREPV